MNQSIFEGKAGEFGSINAFRKAVMSASECKNKLAPLSPIMKSVLQRIQHIGRGFETWNIQSGDKSWTHIRIEFLPDVRKRSSSLMPGEAVALLVGSARHIAASPSWTQDAIDPQARLLLMKQTAELQLDVEALASLLIHENLSRYIDDFDEEDYQIFLSAGIREDIHPVDRLVQMEGYAQAFSMNLFRTGKVENII